MTLNNKNYSHEEIPSFAGDLGGRGFMIWLHYRNINHFATKGVISNCIVFVY